MKRITALLLLLTMTLALLCSCTKKEQTLPPPPSTDTTEDGANSKQEDKVQKIYVDYEEKHRVDLFDIKDKIKINGRCTSDKESGIRVAWPNSGIEFAGWFEGNIRLYFSNAAYLPVDFYVVIDGDYENAKNLTLSPTLSYASLGNLQRGYHTIGLYKVSGAQADNICLTAIEYKGKLDEEPLKKSMSIEIIGDSISCGTGLVSPNYDNDAYYSYGAMLSRSLNADLSIVAVPGWGLACGVKSFDNLIPKIYDLTCHFTHTGEKWDFANNQVDAVIFNLGTNDYLQYANADRTDLHKAFRDFFDTLRECYPEARIYVAYGMMNRVFKDDFKMLVEERNDDKITIVDVPANGAGIGGHPDAEAHVKYARQFEEILRKDFGITDRAGEIGKIIREKTKLVTTVAPEK